MVTNYTKDTNAGKDAVDSMIRVHYACPGHPKLVQAQLITAIFTSSFVQTSRHAFTAEPTDEQVTCC